MLGTQLDSTISDQSTGESAFNVTNSMSEVEKYINCQRMFVCDRRSIQCKIYVSPPLRMSPNYSLRTLRESKLSNVHDRAVEGYRVPTARSVGRGHERRRPSVAVVLATKPSASCRGHAGGQAASPHGLGAKTPAPRDERTPTRCRQTSSGGWRGWRRVGWTLGRRWA